MGEITKLEQFQLYMVGLDRMCSKKKCIPKMGEMLKKDGKCYECYLVYKKTKEKTIND